MIEKARMGKTVFQRSKETGGDWSAWEAKPFPSISQAKKANGLNSKTVQTPPKD